MTNKDKIKSYINNKRFLFKLFYALRVINVKIDKEDFLGKTNEYCKVRYFNPYNPVSYILGIIIL